MHGARTSPKDANDSQAISAQICDAIRIMIIDDQRSMRKIIRQLLHKSHLDNVTEARNGAVALEALNKVGVELPDLIISDLHMDQMDGIDFVANVRRSKNPKLRDIPILILTGDRDQLLHDVSMQVGATKVLTKPITSDALTSEVQQVVGFVGFA